MAKKTLAELIIEPITNIIDERILEDPILLTNKQNVTSGKLGENIELNKINKEVKDSSAIDLDYISTHVNLLGPNSVFTFRIDANDEIDNEDLTDALIGNVIFRELIDNIVKEYKKYKSNPENYFGQEAPFLAYVGVTKKRGIDEKNYFIFDFADTGSGWNRDKLANLRKIFSGSKELKEWITLSPEEKEKKLTKKFTREELDLIKTEKIDIEKILWDEIGPKREKGINQNGSMGFYALYNVLNQLGGVFELNYAIFDSEDTILRYQRYDPFGAEVLDDKIVQIKLNISPDKNIQDYLGNRMKTHLRIKIPCSAITDELIDITQNRTQKLQVTYDGKPLDNAHLMDNFLEGVNEDDQDKKKRTDHLQDYWRD